MTPRDLGNIHTTGYSCKDTQTIRVFLSVNEEASQSLLPSSVLLLPGNTAQPENTYSCIFKVSGQVSESQKGISINGNYSYHQHSFP